jgi:hypothetical protein
VEAVHIGRHGQCLDGESSQYKRTREKTQPLNMRSLGWWARRDAATGFSSPSSGVRIFVGTGQRKGPKTVYIRVFRFAHTVEIITKYQYRTMVVNRSGSVRAYEPDAA